MNQATMKNCEGGSRSRVARRFWCSFLPLAFALALFAGCGGGDDDSGTQPTATPTSLLGGERTPTRTIEVPGSLPTATTTPTAAASTTPTADSCSSTDSCSSIHTILFAISHSHNDPENTILFRVTVPAASTGTSWGDGNNGFFYQVTLSGSAVDDQTLTYVPFNGIGAGSDGQPELPQFWFIVSADQSYTSMAVALCSSNYTAASGSTPSCSNTLWTDTYSSLPSPSVGDPPFGTVTLQIAGASSTQVSVPNNGVYPATVTIDASGPDLDDDDLTWLYNHLVFFDENDDPYTNDEFTDSDESHRSIGVLSIDEAAYQDPVEGTYYTKYGNTASIEKVDSPDRQFFFYTRDTLGTSAIPVAISYMYDEADDCRGYVGGSGGPGSKDACGTSAALGSAAGTSDISPVVDVLPESGQGGAISAYPQNSVEAGEEENRTITFEPTSSSLCTSVTNPLAINVSGEAYNQPDYVIDDTSGTWGMSFPHGLYYVLPTGFGNCDSSTTPFCHRTSNYTAYVPHYANSNGASGTLNGGSTTDTTVGSFALADEYELGTSGLGSSNSLVWFDNCGYGYIYEECPSCEYPLGTRKTLPDPPSGRDTYEYTLKNSLSFPIVFGKECCSSYYQQNQTTDAYEPPSQLDDGFGAFLPAGGSLTYETLFSDEAIVAYNAATGEKLFKLRLNTETPAVYACDLDDWSASVGSTSPYAVEIAETGVEDLECGTVGDCPFGMTASTDGDTVTCTATQSSFLLGLPDWAATLPAFSFQVRAWGGKGGNGGKDDLNSGGDGEPGGYASTILSPTDLSETAGWLAYVGVGGKGGSNSGGGYGGSSTVLTARALSAIGSDDAEMVLDPSAEAVVLIAGGGGGGGGSDSDDGKRGGAGGKAIATAGAAVSAAGSDNSGDDGDGGNANGEGEAGDSHATAGLGGFGNDTKWESSGSLVWPTDWAAGKGGDQDETAGGRGGGGGGFGGGGRGKSEDPGTGGGGGGSWAAANTADDASAPTTAPDSPNGSDGAVEIVFTKSFPCSLAEASSRRVVRCSFTSSELPLDVTQLVTLITDQTGLSADVLPVYVEAYGGRGGKGFSVSCGGGTTANGGGQGKSGYARSSYMASSLQDDFPTLYLYVGSAGEGGSSSTSCGGYGGGGGASSLVLSQSLENVSSDASPDDATALLIAGGGGGGSGGSHEELSHGSTCNGGVAGSAGSKAEATTDGDVSGAATDAYSGGAGQGACSELSNGTCGTDGIGGLGGAVGSDTTSPTSWLGSDFVDWTAGAGAAGGCSGGGGGGWGGGQAGLSLTTLGSGGGGGGGSYARQSTIDDSSAPILGKDDTPNGGDGTVVFTFDPCGVDATLMLCTE